jgi:hypothetical protein
VAKLGRVGLVAEAYRGQLLEDQAEVGDLDVRTDRPGGAEPVEELVVQLVGAHCQPVQLLGRRERASQPDGQRGGVGVYEPAHEAGERHRRHPRVLPPLPLICADPAILPGCRSVAGVFARQNSTVANSPTWRKPQRAYARRAGML